MLEMGIPTLRRSHASRTTAKTELDSYPFSLRAAHCWSMCFVSPVFAVDAFGTMHSVTAVGGTASIPEVAAPFSGGGFSDIVSFRSFRSKFECNSDSDGENFSSRARRIKTPPCKGFSKYCPKTPTRDSSILMDACVGNHLSLSSVRRPNTARRPTVSFPQAIPDVSAQAENFRIFVRGYPTPISGTSASAPTFAGLVALLNDARIAAGKPPLGFLNPLIYRLGGEAFNDITAGNAPGCGTPGFNVSGTLHFVFASLRA